MAFSIGSSESRNRSVSRGYDRTAIDQTQLPFLQQLWGNAMGQATGAGQAAQGALGYLNPMMQGAMGNVAQLTDPTAQIQAQTSSLASGLGDLFRNEINPALESNAIAMGGLGGGSQAGGHERK